MARTIPAETDRELKSWLFTMVPPRFAAGDAKLLSRRLARRLARLPAAAGRERPCGGNATPVFGGVEITLSVREWDEWSKAGLAESATFVVSGPIDVLNRIVSASEKAVALMIVNAGCWPAERRRREPKRHKMLRRLAVMRVPPIAAERILSEDGWSGVDARGLWVSRRHAACDTMTAAYRRSWVSDHLSCDPSPGRILAEQERRRCVAIVDRDEPIPAL